MLTVKPMYSTCLNRMLTCYFKSKYKFQLASKRKLICPTSLNIPRFQEARKNAIKSSVDLVKFKEGLKDSLMKNENLVFQEDIKKLTYTSDTDDDLELLKCTLTKFCKQSNIIRFSSYSCGPDIMKLHYILNKPQEALALIKNPDTYEMFLQASSLIILFKLLFDNEMYDDLIEIFNFNREKESISKYHPSLVIMCLASCYKLNSPGSYDYALELWETFENVGYKCPVRGILFLGMLALNQNFPEKSLIILDELTKSTELKYNVEFRALARSGKYAEVLRELQNHLYVRFKKSHIKYFITMDTFQYLENEFRHTSEEYMSTLKKLKKEYEIQNFISELALESHLCKEIIIKTKPKNSNTK